MNNITVTVKGPRRLISILIQVAEAMGLFTECRPIQYNWDGVLDRLANARTELGLVWDPGPDFPGPFPSVAEQEKARAFFDMACDAEIQKSVIQLIIAVQTYTIYTNMAQAMDFVDRMLEVHN
jgi:hypothetical protein